MEVKLDLNFSITYPEVSFPEGVTLITGPSGVGKTTLLRALHGDYDSAFARMVKRQKTALMPQQQKWVSYMTMREQLSMTVDDIWETYAMRLGLQEHFNKLPSQLSIGQQQRFWLTWVLAEEAQWVLLDEPTSALDDDWASIVIALFDEYQKNKVHTKMVIVTHDVRLIQGKIHNHHIAL